MSHLTLQDRITIQSELNQGSSFNTIARLISESPTTLSREIRNHLLIRDRSSYPQSRMMNDCLHRFECRLKFVCLASVPFSKGELSFLWSLFPGLS